LLNQLQEFQRSWLGCTDLLFNRTLFSLPAGAYRFAVQFFSLFSYSAWCVRRPQFKLFYWIPGIASAQMGLVRCGVALRNGFAKLAAMAQQEDDPEVLERIASRIQDALSDKIDELRAQKKKQAMKAGNP
jgi:hypothetical protein